MHHTTVSPSKQTNNTQSIKSNGTAQPTKSHISISKGDKPTIPLQLPSGYTIHVFAKNLGNARDEVFSPGGTLLVSNPSTNQVYALPDNNNDGVADENKTIINGENHVHGLAFYGGKLFVADVDKVVRYTWDETSLTVTKDKELFSLPQNSDHNARTIVFDQSGNMFVSVGSTCNVCHETADYDATVLESNANGDNPHIFAKGLRNAAFLAFNPQTNDLWATEMGRDYLGDNTPSDEINIVKQGNDYGWPYCYGYKIHDDNFDPSKTHNCTNTIAPIYDIPAHSAPLGLTFINSVQFPLDWQNDLLVAYHGSWNRTTPIGYKIVHLKVNGNIIINSDDFLTGFAPLSTPNNPNNYTNKAKGRPVDMVFDKAGNLYVSDDKAGEVYIIQRTQ